MDWPDIQDPYVTDARLNQWRYKQTTTQASDESLVLYAERCHTNGQFPAAKQVHLPNNAEWVMPWLQSPCFRQELLLRLPQNQADISGFHILFPSRVKPFEIRDENDDLKTSPKEHYYLPFSKANWARIVKHFHINRVIMDAMRENKCYTGFQNKRLQNDHMIRWFTGVTSPKNDPLSVSMSAVYFPQYRLSLAVVYNCDTMQLNLVKRLLRASPEASSHSLLMVGLFVEIQHHRISALMSDVTKELDQITTILNSKSSKFEYEENQKLRDALVAAKHCEEEARTARSQLEKIMKHATDHEKADHRGASAEYIQTTKRFKERFKQIYYQLEAISAESRVKAEELRTTSDLYLAQLARSEAREAASLAFSATRQAEISKYIALMAMFYLPLTAVSTIFATPVFKFENHWVDVNWKFRGGGAKDSNSPEPDLPVFSGYFLIYIALGIFFTAGTLGSYWYKFYYSKPKRRDHESAATAQDDDADATHSDSDASHSRPNILAAGTAKPPEAHSQGSWYRKVIFWSRTASTTSTNGSSSPAASTVGAVVDGSNIASNRPNPASTNKGIWSRITSVLLPIRLISWIKGTSSAPHGHELGAVPPLLNNPASNRPSNPQPDSMV